MGAGYISAAGLAGNWSWTVVLLVPLALVLAYLTARILGSLGEPPPGRRGGSGGVSQYLERHASGKDGSR